MDNKMFIYHILPMSIATLKKKTAAKYNNSSVGEPQFSINGGYRNQGYVGQDLRGRFLSRTLMKGTTPKGHGGCCGTYYVGPIVSSSVKSQNDSSVMKSSSLGNLGHIMTKYRWARRPVLDGQGNPTGYAVKPDSNINNFTSHIFTIQQGKQAILDASNCPDGDETPKPICKSTVPLSNKCQSLNITANPSDTGAISSGIYSLGTGKCNLEDNVKPVSSTSSTPLPS